MRDRICVVTGGAGLVGSHICDLLIAEGAAEIRVLDDFSRGTRGNLEPALASGRVRIVEGDVRDAGLVHETLEGAEVVFHQAAIRITQCASENRLALEVLVAGTFNVLEACVRHHVGKLVAASSASVYGRAEVFPTRESHHTYGNRTLYGACKVANEQMLRAFSEMYDLPYVALRYFNVYGPRMDVAGAYTEVLVRWLDAFEAGRTPRIFGDGAQTMDFVYIEDVARANLLAASAPVADACFNVGSGCETSLRELYDELAGVAGFRHVVPDFAPLPPERQGVEIPRRLAAVDDASAHIDFKARIGLGEGLQKFVAWRASTGSGR